MGRLTDSPLEMNLSQLKEIRILAISIAITFEKKAPAICGNSPSRDEND